MNRSGQFQNLNNQCNPSADGRIQMTRLLPGGVTQVPFLFFVCTVPYKNKRNGLFRKTITGMEPFGAGRTVF
jgi:hypothetical protein